MSVLMSGLTTGATGLLVPAVTVLGLGLAPAAPGTDPGPQAWGPRLEEVCRQVPVRIARVTAAQDRLAAGARTPGSIAFLEARIARAESAGEEDLARLLGNRLATRRDIAALLPDVLLRLEDAEQVCRAHRAEAPAGSSGTSSSGSSSSGSASSGSASSGTAA